jgi:hypothetical protein
MTLGMAPASSITCLPPRAAGTRATVDLSDASV